MIRPARPTLYIWLCIVLIAVPYPVYMITGNGLFGGSYAGIGQHAITIAVIVTAMLAGYFAGHAWKTRQRPLPQDRAATGTLVVCLLWTPVIVSILAHLPVMWLRFDGAHPDFIAIRLALEPVPGLGLLFRTYLVALPLILMLRPHLRRREKALLGVLGILVLIRAEALSERLAVIEYVLTLLICVSLRTGLVLALHKTLAMGAALYMLAAFLLWRRLLDQGNMPGSFLGFMSENFVLNVTYYAVNLNSLYFRMHEGMDLDMPRWFLLPVEKVLARLDGVRLENPAAWSDFLIARDNAGFGDFWLNNPGGITQDFSDFGVLFVLVIFMKFFVFGRVARLMQSGSLTALAVYPVFCIAIAEYPRFNYFYLSFGLGLVVGGALLGAVIGRLLRAHPSIRRDAMVRGE